MDQDQEKMLKYLISVEKVGEEVMFVRNEIMLLHKRKEKNREALRDLLKAGQKKCWLTVGSVLVKHNVCETQKLLNADQKQLDVDIKNLQIELKDKVNEYRDLEMQTPIKGSLLVPLSAKETAGLSSAGLFSR